MRPLIGAQRADFRNADLKIAEYLEQEGLEFLIGTVNFVDQQNRWPRRYDGLQQRPRQQKMAREESALLMLQVGHRLIQGIGVGQQASQPFLEHLHVEQLFTVLPLVQRLRLIQPLVTLQANELPPGGVCQHLRQLRFADSGRPFNEQRTLQLRHQVNGGGNVLAAHVVGAAERLDDALGRSQLRVFRGWGEGTCSNQNVLLKTFNRTPERPARRWCRRSRKRWTWRRAKQPAGPRWARSPGRSAGPDTRS